MRLYVFPVSHFCEKARWACDHHGLPYELIPLVPGPHAVTVKRLGARHTSVPVWVERGGEAIQGSNRIISRLDALQPARSLTPVSSEWESLVKRADRDFGEGLRRIFYASMMTRTELIPVLAHKGAWWAKPTLHAFFPVLAAGLTKSCRLYPDEVARAKVAFEDAWADLEAQLDGRAYLYEDRLTRADITVASLLAPMITPTEHPFPWARFPQAHALSPFVERYRGRPLWRYVEALYARHRRCAEG